MYYEINVSKAGKHVFATAPRSIDTAKSALNVFQLIDTKFPASEGYEVTVTKYETYGQQIDPAAL